MSRGLGSVRAGPSTLSQTNEGQRRIRQAQDQLISDTSSCGAYYSAFICARAGRRSPPWAKRERASDLAWISENLHVSGPVAHQAYEEHSRGAIVADTTQRPTGEGHPFGYFRQALVVQTGDEDTQRMVSENGPSWRTVTILPKIHDQTNTYRARGHHELEPL